MPPCQMPHRFCPPTANPVGRTHLVYYIKITTIPIVEDERVPLSEDERVPLSEIVVSDFNNENDVLIINGKNDTIFVSNEDHVLVGGDGNDIIIGGGGNDIIEGNRESDTFELGADALEFATIVDFDRVEGDLFQVTGSQNDYTLSLGNVSGNAAVDTIIEYQGNRVAVAVETVTVDLNTDFVFL